MVSPLIVKPSDAEDDARNRLRSVGPTAKYLQELVELLGYPYRKKWTLRTGLHLIAGAKFLCICLGVVDVGAAAAVIVTVVVVVLMEVFRFLEKF